MAVARLLGVGATTFHTSDVGRLHYTNGGNFSLWQLRCSMMHQRPLQEVLCRRSGSMVQPMECMVRGSSSAADSYSTDQDILFEEL
jgi:hypothetical protein